MLKAFAKLTKSKSLPPTDDQIRKHKDQRRQLEKWRNDVKGLRMILDKLKTQYEGHKGDFALGRYEELKEMIKSAVSQCSDAVKENSNHRYEPGSSDRSGKITSLCKNAASFSEKQEQVSSEEQRYSTISASEVDQELRNFRIEILELREQFRKYRQNIEKLGVEYEESKKLNPTQRYPAMKNMIKNTLSASSLL